MLRFLRVAARFRLAIFFCSTVSTGFLRGAKVNFFTISLFSPQAPMIRLRRSRSTMSTWASSFLKAAIAAIQAALACCTARAATARLSMKSAASACVYILPPRGS